MSYVQYHSIYFLFWIGPDDMICYLFSVAKLRDGKVLLVPSFCSGFRLVGLRETEQLPMVDTVDRESLLRTEIELIFDSTLLPSSSILLGAFFLGLTLVFRVVAVAVLVVRLCDDGVFRGWLTLDTFLFGFGMDDVTFSLLLGPLFIELVADDDTLSLLLGPPFIELVAADDTLFVSSSPSSAYSWMDRFALPSSHLFT
mmetsp:Transcript_20832/g.27432  ORF Transcript_20832/g.27432 Transcript_20832/m.27432 type:complete len:199 (-) Transcript_20832:3269-3865(-)